MMSNQYIPGRFVKLHVNYPVIWEFLNDPIVIARMTAISRRGLPAILVLDSEAETIWRELRLARQMSQFSELKQMIGHQVKQVMESCGYRKVGVKPITTSWIFSSGSVYRDPAWHDLYLFRERNLSDFFQFCIAKKRRLSSLPNPPAHQKKWAYFRKCSMLHELEFAMDSDLYEDFGWHWRDLYTEVEHQGYVILADLTNKGRR